MSASTSSGHNAENAYRRSVPGADICRCSKFRALLDNLIGAGEQRRRNVQTKRGRLLDRKVGRLAATQNSVNILGAPDKVRMHHILGDRAPPPSRSQIPHGCARHPITGSPFIRRINSRSSRRKSGRIEFSRTTSFLQTQSCFDRALRITSSAVGGFGGCQLRQSGVRTFTGRLTPSVEK